MRHDVFYLIKIWLLYIYKICKISSHPKKSNIFWMLLGTTGFWVWTNLGVYLHSGLYIKTITGFIACYSAALPFLQKALIGDLFWFVTLSFCLSMINFNFIKKYKIAY